MIDTIALLLLETIGWQNEWLGLFDFERAEKVEKSDMDKQSSIDMW